ncbi:MAG: RluA family pseudouridine synthase [Oscillospiraceae bacterium]|nr:RluA family pseudouridine synthase [Oscillospiraceae bacterium]MBR2976685.1 RluA family pseudouridine synthase [Oscillospiraceae bacterium]MBR3849177.1 RluA family pseudouridine synthase [Oscillospiraceae bacterium]
MKEFSVGKNDAGQRLDRYLSKTIPLLPPGLLQKSIRLKRIKLNGKPAKRDTRIAEGDTVQAYISDEFFEAPKEENAFLTVAVPSLSIVYEDENILLADKRPGVAVHPHDGAEYGRTLIDQIQAYLYQKGEWNPKESDSFTPALCNRIDRNTGGIVIAAKNAQALRIINEKIRTRELDKRYLCITVGTPKNAEGELIRYLVKDEKHNLVRVYRKPTGGAKTAVTRYHTLKSSGKLSLVEVELETGRTHQIRACFADAGFPLLGDGKYGRGEVNRAHGETRQCLYAYKLRFCFRTDAGALQYLNGKTFRAQTVPFAETYFGGTP